MRRVFSSCFSVQHILAAQQVFCNNNRPWKGRLWLRTPRGWKGAAAVSQLWLGPVPGVLCGSLSTAEQDSWLPQNWCETSHGVRVAGWRGHQKKKKKWTAGVWERFQTTTHSFFQSSMGYLSCRSQKCREWLLHLRSLYLFLRVVLEGWWLTRCLHCPGCRPPSLLAIWGLIYNGLLSGNVKRAVFTFLCWEWNLAQKVEGVAALEVAF